MKVRALVLGAMVLPSALHGQGSTKSAASTATTGDCSPAISSPSAPITINCRLEGLTKDQAARQAREYSDILNRIRRENLSFDQVIEKLDTIQADVSDIKRGAAHRHLTPVQRSSLDRALKPYSGRRIEIYINFGDIEAGEYATEFVQIARANKLTGTEGSGFGQSVYAQTIKGLVLFANESDVAVNKIPTQCAAFLTAMTTTGITVTPIRNPEVKTGSCTLVVGVKE